MTLFLEMIAMFALGPITFITIIIIMILVHVILVWLTKLHFIYYLRKNADKIEFKRVYSQDFSNSELHSSDVVFAYIECKLPVSFTKFYL